MEFTKMQGISEEY